MNSLLPSNTTAQERALEATTARIGTLPVPVRKVWNPDTCPEHMLPWLAWAFSVDRWDAQWSVEQKRRIIATSVAVHRKKGTPAAVREVIELVFGGGEILEAWEFGGQPHTFKIATTGLLASADDYAQLIRMVDATKPARSWLLSVQVRRRSQLSFTLGTYTHTGISMQINHTLNPTTDPARNWHATGIHHASTTAIHPAGVAISLPAMPLLMGGGQHIATTITIQPRT